jgi:hypothetical protein
MHYAKRIARAHRTLRSRLGVLQSLVEDWPLGDSEEEGVGTDRSADLTREDFTSAIGRWKDRKGSLQSAVAVGKDGRVEVVGAEGDTSAEIRALRERIDRVERGVEALDETGKRSVTCAILKMHREKFRIERYSQWHARSKGMNPISRHPQFHIPREKPAKNHV